MKNKSKGIIIAVIIIVIVAFALLGSILGSGNNGYTQNYEFNVNSTTLIKAIKDLKVTNPEFNPPSSIYDPDSLDRSNDHYNMEIYSKKAETSFGFFIDNNSNTATIHLVSMNKGLDYKEWKTINHDLDRHENINTKHIFEEDILNKLNLKYQNKGNSMFIFWK